MVAAAAAVATTTEQYPTKAGTWVPAFSYFAGQGRTISPEKRVSGFDHVGEMCYNRGTEAAGTASAGLPQNGEKPRKGSGEMHNELTRKDLQMMREELDYRRITLRPQLLEAVKEARGFGDLSENFEYKAAKQEKNRNESRIRFLENMIRTAVVISDQAAPDTVGLYDKVTVYLEEDDETETYQVVTTMRQDALHGRISKESPVGSALLGKRVGDRIYIQVNDNYGYYMVIKAIEKGEDDGSVPLNRF